MTCTHGHAYCALCSAVKQHETKTASDESIKSGSELSSGENAKTKKTASAKRRDRWIRRLKLTGRWVEKPSSSL